MSSLAISIGSPSEVRKRSSGRRCKVCSKKLNSFNLSDQCLSHNFMSRAEGMELMKTLDKKRVNLIKDINAAFRIERNRRIKQ